MRDTYMNAFFSGYRAGVRELFEIPSYECKTTDMRRLTTGISSEKCVVRRFRRCANMYVHKAR